MKTNIADIRKDYAKKDLDTKDCLDDPIAQFEIWLDEAIKSEVPEPTAMIVSSADENGRPSSRTVLLKGVEDKKFIFYTNYTSRKGKQILANPYVSVTFFWPELERQVQIEGKALKVASDTSDKYFESRPYKSKVGAWASEQSTVINSRSVIMERFAKFSLKYLTSVPRPDHWGGFEIEADRIEFWQGRPSRLHDRILYTKDENGEWGKNRLAP
ncbi:pyridoxamine 5'-phosphate oxidase [Sediminitomix flava]|uniref:Pyridoxine/pyridoxamine 5'-phosphate oxidase n=1 Tax=Sediminitomix flava TaxID=379075 RepID=A0A315ZFI0_SEDFL|nr:pyridoxamine 5'-phosphate oxidase [Sediminitomix flava]PWJ44261.1 pyridoxamine 5'-phosphate oxidase [Sediminitomix flava]